MEYKLADLFDLQMGKTPSRNDIKCWDKGVYNWISIADLSNCGQYIHETKEKISDYAVKVSGIKVIPANTVIMSFKLSIGKVAITSRPIYSNEAIMAFINKGKIYINPEYLYYLLLHKNWEDGSNKAVMGKTLNKSNLSQVKIKIDSSKYQDEIVKKLNLVNQIITDRKKQLKSLDELVKSRFVEMFGDPVRNEKKWIKGNMQSICIRITDGEHGSVPRSEIGHPFLNAKHIKPDGTIDWKTTTFVANEVHEKIYRRCNPETGDILVTTTGTIGNVVIVPDTEPFSMDRGITLLKLQKEKISSIFIAWLLKFDSIQEIMNANIHASAIGHLFLNKVKQLPVIIPPLELQNEFSSFVIQVDKSRLLFKCQLLQYHSIEHIIRGRNYG